MRGSGMIVLLALALAGCAPPKPAAPPPKPATVVTDTSPHSAAVVTLADLKAAHRRVRSFMLTIDAPRPLTTIMKLDGQSRPVAIKTLTPGAWSIMDVKRKVIYQYLVKEKLALKVPYTMGAQGGAPPMEFDIDLTGMDLTAPLTKTAQCGGVRCRVVTRPATKHAPALTAWIDEQYGLMRQLEVNKKITRFTYTRINAVPEREFTLPPGTNIKNYADRLPSTHPPRAGKASARPPGTAPPLPAGHPR